MKKNIIIFCTVLTTLSLTAFSVLNLNDSEPDKLETFVIEDMENKEYKPIYGPFTTKIEKRIFTDFIYDVGPRFGSVTKEELNNARFFQYYIGRDHAQRIVSYKSLSVIIIKNDELTDIRKTVFSNELNAAQLEFMQSFDYSTNFMIRADYVEKNKESGKIEESSWTPYLTLVPKKQAAYATGKDALKKFLKEECKDQLADVDPEKLKPAKLYFTVTKNGAIENVKLDRPSGYPEVDKRMIELISKTHGKWEPAENANGEKVDQELVVSFGLMGC